MTTPILNITEVANNQVNQYLTVNEALRALESSFNEIINVDLSSGDVTLTNTSPDYVFSRNSVFRATGNSVPRVLTVPASSKGLFIVWNSGTEDLIVKRGLTEITVPDSSSSLFYADGTANGLIGIAGGGGGSSPEVEIGSIVSGVLDLSALDVETVSVELTENITSIIYPSGVAGLRKDLMIRFQQDGTGGRTVDLTGIAWEGGSPPLVGSDPGEVTYVAATNVDENGWEGFQ